MWHSFWSTDGETKLMAGLNEEAMERLAKRGVVLERVKTDPDWQFCFSPAELACELDRMVEEAGVIPFLHARAVAAPSQDGRITAVVIEDKSGRRAIRAKQFIDASGDADLCWLAGGEAATARRSHLQPPTTAGIFEGLEGMKDIDPEFKLGKTVYDTENPHHLGPGFLWAAPLPGSHANRTVFGTRVKGVDCSVAEDLTFAEMDGRKQLRQILDSLKYQYGSERDFGLVALPACIGIRDTRHAQCQHQLTEEEVLEGTDFDDAIAFGSYRVDVHHQGEAGITFRYLDGTESIRYTDGRPSTDGRWREERETDPTYYQIPFRSLMVNTHRNLLAVGRCLDADIGAFGAVRVMVNCNQMGEAAAVASVLACQQETDSQSIDPAQIRAELLKQDGVIPNM